MVLAHTRAVPRRTAPVLPAVNKMINQEQAPAAIAQCVFGQAGLVEFLLRRPRALVGNLNGNGLFAGVPADLISLAGVILVTVLNGINGQFTQDDQPHARGSLTNAVFFQKVCKGCTQRIHAP